MNAHDLHLPQPSVRDACWDSDAASTTQDDKQEFVPRAYQEEIFSEACNDNVIAVLSTGSGKTFIAALLIKWVMAQPSSIGKKAVFLVPKVPLVDQQRDFIASQTPLVVRGYKGAMGVDEWDKTRWEDELGFCDCVVMTPQIFKNILLHGFWTLELVSILVLDEVHHARGQHPYFTIMNESFLNCEDRPKVFGMTASPILDPKKPQASLQNLESTLQAKIMMVQKHAKELEQYTNKPVEVVLRYETGPDSEPYGVTLWQELEESGLICVPGLALTSTSSRHNAVLSALGPVAADQFLVSTIKVMLSVLSKRPELADEELQLRKQQVEALKLRIQGTKSQLDEAFRRRQAEISRKFRRLLDVLQQCRSENFCGIVFVEQRQVATALSWALSLHVQTRDWIKSKVLTGQGATGANGETTPGMSLSDQKNAVISLKNASVNLLIATSVAEEGLDFPVMCFYLMAQGHINVIGQACELVICFDPPKNHQAFIQTRGRARQSKSKYVVMIEESDHASFMRHERFRIEEESLKSTFQDPKKNKHRSPAASPTDDNDPLTSFELSLRQIYTVHSTGAGLTYSSAIDVLEHLCALIPRDAYTPPLQPKYSAEIIGPDYLSSALTLPPATHYYRVTIRLPFAIPLAPEYQEFRGPERLSKKEAKKATAFLVARNLHKLGVLDDHLLPVKASKGKTLEDADSRTIDTYGSVTPMMDAMVVDPWKIGPLWYLHAVYLNDIPCAGLISGSIHPRLDFTFKDIHIAIRPTTSAAVQDLDDHRVGLLSAFTKSGIWWCVSPSLIPFDPVCLLCPLDETMSIDWKVLEAAVASDKGVYEWRSVTVGDEGMVMLENSRKFGRPLRFLRFRPDLSLNTSPPVDSGSTFATYAEYFEHKYAINKPKKKDFVERPPAGRVLEVAPWPRSSSSDYHLQGGTGALPAPTQEDNAMTPFLLPESFCRRVLMPKAVLDAFHVLAPLCQRICDVFRVQAMQEHLSLPSIPVDLLIEATTIPAAVARFNNQRLETMGDSVLKLGVITYIFNKFPQKHEGQLESLKSNSVSNRLLFTRARKIDLERFLSCETRNNRTWSFRHPSPENSSTWETSHGSIPCVKRNFARRSLQDCMESILGAAYVYGGIYCALRTGDALGLCFGGGQPWHERYEPARPVPTAPLFLALQEELGYSFTNGALLVEAVTHSSFDAEHGPCYQRLEFLGDAVIELVVTTYLFNKFPEAQSGTLSWVRARVICNVTLGALAVKRLSLHKHLLANNVALSKDIAKEVPILQGASYNDIVTNVWRYDPPKVLADLFESVIGALFVDSNFDYPKIAAIIEKLMQNALVELHLDISKDPVSHLLQWAAKSGCTRVKFMKSSSDPLFGLKDCFSFLVHDQVVAGPLSAPYKPRAKGLVAEEAFATLSDPSSPTALVNICTCREIKEKEKIAAEATEIKAEEEELDLQVVRERKLDLETTQGCALIGALRGKELISENADVETVDDTGSLTDGYTSVDERDVYEMLLSPISIATKVAELGVDGLAGFSLSQSSAFEVERMVSEEMDMDWD